MLFFAIYAKEMQKILMRNKDELESQLNRARGMDFSNTKTDVVAPGVIVHVTDPASSQAETFTILGAWDSDPDKGVISYLTPIAQALLNHKVGDEVEFELHGFPNFKYISHHHMPSYSSLEWKHCLIFVLFVCRGVPRPLSLCFPSPFCLFMHHRRKKGLFQRYAQALSPHALWSVEHGGGLHRDSRGCAPI